jgi:D-alanine-D-alanine ligase
MLECLRIPYVGAGVLASALCLDKLRFKTLMAEAGIPQTCYRVIYEDRMKDESDVVIDELARLTFPLFVKPVSSGSSLGVTRAAGPAELRESLAEAFDFGLVAIVEVAGGPCEVECSVIGNVTPFASVPGEVAVVSSRSGWRDHETKSTNGSINLFVPARISERALAEVQRLSLLAFEATGCCGLARVDFFVDGDRVLLNEVNTMPGLMKLSVFPLMLEASGITYTEMIDRLVRLALDRRARALSRRI